MEALQDLVWLWMLLGFTILPMVRQFMTSMKRKSIIAKLENERGTKIISMIHRQGAGLLGVLFQRYINLDDSEAMMKEIRAAGDRPIDLLLHTPGGLVIAAEQIARMLQAHKPGVTVIVPQYAMSGGTMLALAADAILLDQHAMLGPIDPQLNGYPASAYLRVMREKDINAVADSSIMMADMAEKAANQLYQMAYDLLKTKMGPDRASEVATMLTEGRWTHDFPLHVEQLEELGLPVSTDVPAGFMELMELSRPAQQQIMKKEEKKVDKA